MATSNHDGLKPPVESNGRLVPPQIFCPGCANPLVYRRTLGEDTGPMSRRDYLECRACGPFEYSKRRRATPAATSPRPDDWVNP
jgi:hypothetical protein